MPKILRILNRFNLGGPVYNATYLSADLPPEFETLLIGGAAEPEEKDALFIPQGEGVYPQIVSEFQRAVSPTADFKAYRKVRSIIRDFRPEIVHTHASKAGAIGRLAALHENVPVIVHTFHGHIFHSYFHPVKTAAFKRIERQLAKRSSAVIAISQQQRHELQSIHGVVPEDKIRLIPLGFALDRFTVNAEQRRKAFREQYGFGEHSTLIGIIGRFAAVKNHRMFMDTILRVKQNITGNVCGVLIGDGAAKDDLKAYAVSIGLSNSEHSSEADLLFTSWIEDIATVLPALDFVVLTSHNEGTPVSLIEAQAAGVPVLSTNVGGVRDILPSESHHLLTEPGDSEKMAREILHLTGAPKECERLAIRGRKFVHEHFTRKRLAADTTGLYRELLAEQRIH